MMKTKLILGTILLLLSIKPLFLMGQELFYQNQAKSDELIEHIYVNSMELGKVEILGKGVPIDVEDLSVRNSLLNGENDIELVSSDEYHSLVGQETDSPLTYVRIYNWKGHVIRITDQFHPGTFNEDDREHASMSININEKDWSKDSLIEVRPYTLDENRYHGYFGVLITEDQEDEKLILIQRVSGIDFVQEKDLAWRTLTIEEDGHVQEDYFTYDERAKIPKRVDYINTTMTSPFALGYKSEILQGWPSVFFPLLYPIVSGVIGFVLIILGGINVLRRKSSANTE